MADNLIVGHQYTRDDVHVIMGFPELVGRKGYWVNGYVSYSNGWSCIYANVGIPGRDGHDYDNRWVNEKTLHWEATKDSRVGTESIDNLLVGKTHIFTRGKESRLFTYHGIGKANVISSEKPVIVEWSFDGDVSSEQIEIDIAIEQDINYETGKEGSKKQFYTTRYERNPKLRKEAIKLHGTTCMGCGFNFFNVYGERGRNYIEVHHIKPLNEYCEETEIDPLDDLVVLCSNCHRMVHRKRSETLTMKELKKILGK